MKKLQDLAIAIDAASDAGDEEALRQLGKECEESLDGATGEDRVFLFYCQANTYSAIVTAKTADPAKLWDWELPDAVQNILLLRRAIAEPSFGTIDQIRACQIRTNLANRLNALGRPVAANEQWLKVLETEPRFAKALANRAQAIAFYATTLYDKGHEVCLLAAARTLFDATLSMDALCLIKIGCPRPASPLRGRGFPMQLHNTKHWVAVGLSFELLKGRQRLSVKKSPGNGLFVQVDFEDLGTLSRVMFFLDSHDFRVSAPA